MNLETMVRVLIDHYEWNGETSQLRTLGELLSSLSDAAHEAANNSEERERSS